MNCWNCNYELKWNCDYDFEDYGMEGEGIVSILSCDYCEAEVKVSTPNNSLRTSMQKSADAEDPNYISPKLSKILGQAKISMKRYTKKLRMEKYDTPKQSKRK